MLKLEKGFFDVAFHGELDCAFGVVPVEVNSNVAVTFPLGFHWVVIADGFLRCKASALLTYLMPKLSTTRVKEMGLVLWTKRPAVCLDGNYPALASTFFSSLSASIPDCFRPYNACRISM